MVGPYSFTYISVSTSHRARCEHTLTFYQCFNFLVPRRPALRHTVHMWTSRPTTPPNSAPCRSAPRLKNDKLYCLSLQGLHCKLRRAVPCREMKAGKSLSRRRVFSAFPCGQSCTIARRVMWRKNSPPCIISIWKNPRIFTRRAAPSGATFAEFCSAAQRGEAQRGAAFGDAVDLRLVYIMRGAVRCEQSLDCPNLHLDCPKNADLLKNLNFWKRWTFFPRRAAPRRTPKLEFLFFLNFFPRILWTNS